MTTAREVLEKSIDLLKQGWTQGYFWADEEGNKLLTTNDNIPKVQSVCGVGALMLATRLLGATDHVMTEAEHLVGAQAEVRGVKKAEPCSTSDCPVCNDVSALIVDFNDQHATNQHEVIDLFKDALANAPLE